MYVDWFTLTPPTPLELDGMVQAWLRHTQHESVHLSFDSAASRCSSEASPRPSPPVIGGSILASPFLVLGSNVSSGWYSLEDFHLKRPVCQMQGSILARDLETLGLAPVGHQLIDFSLPVEFVETVQSSTALSTRKLYFLKLLIFGLWGE